MSTPVRPPAHVRRARPRRLARAVVPVAAALALSACAGLEFQWANTGSVAKFERRVLDLYDPMSPVNVWNVF